MVHHTDNALESMHLSAQVAAQQVQALQFFITGHISVYDAPTHRCKVVFPSFTDGQGNFMESGWIQMGTLWTGNGYGMQIAPYGGATITDVSGQQTNPDASPEQVLVSVESRDGTLYINGLWTFNSPQPPPGAGMALFDSAGDVSTTQIQQGECFIRHSCGSNILIRNDGSIQINAVPVPKKPFTEPQTNAVVRTVQIQAVAEPEPDQPSGQSDTLQSRVDVMALADAKSVDSADVTSTMATAVTARATQADTTVTSTWDTTNAADGDMATATTILATLATATSTHAATANAPITVNASGGTAPNSAAGNFSVTSSGMNNVAAGSFVVNSSSGTTDTATISVGCMSSNSGAATGTFFVSGGTTTSLTISAASAGTGDASMDISSIGNGASTITITADGTVTVDCDDIQLGTGTRYRLLNDLSAQVYNNHTHPTPSGTSSVPNQQITSANECQNVYGG